jgi:hypothetical protein
MDLEGEQDMEDVTRCPVDDVEMDPLGAWWWTENGAACSEACARQLAAQDGEP